MSVTENGQKSLGANDTNSAHTQQSNRTTHESFVERTSHIVIGALFELQHIRELKQEHNDDT